MAKDDPIKAVLAFEEDLAKHNRKIIRNFKWDDYRYSKLPTSHLPPTEENDKINAILVKSWETQGSSLKKRPVLHEDFLVTNKCMEINGLLIYYFKNLNLADNMVRVVGSLTRSHTFVHSFLKIGDHFIDNAFAYGEMKHWKDNPEMIYNHCLNARFNVGDPADPKYNVIPQSSLIGNLSAYS